VPDEEIPRPETTLDVAVRWWVKRAVDRLGLHLSEEAVAQIATAALEEAHAVVVHELRVVGHMERPWTNPERETPVVD
jgi:hypothetical protein